MTFRSLFKTEEDSGNSFSGIVETRSSQGNWNLGVQSPAGPGFGTSPDAAFPAPVRLPTVPCLGDYLNPDWADSRRRGKPKPEPSFGHVVNAVWRLGSHRPRANE